MSEVQAYVNKDGNMIMPDAKPGDVTMEDVIKNVEAQIAENERRRRQRNEERRKRNFERKNRRPFNKKGEDVKPAAKAEEAKAAE